MIYCVPCKVSLFTERALLPIYTVVLSVCEFEKKIAHVKFSFSLETKQTKYTRRKKSNQVKVSRTHLLSALLLRFSLREIASV